MLSTEELAISLTNFIKNNIEFIESAACKSLKVEKDETAKNFTENYIKKIDTFRGYIESNIEKDTRENLTMILNNELNYLFKNYQIIYKDKFKLETYFIVSEDCCDICRFLSKTNNDLKYHFLHDDCESFLKLKPEITETINIVSPRFKLKNVPVKYKNIVESFLRLVIMKYDYLIKDKLVLIYFNDPAEYNKEDNILLFYKDAIPYQKFNLLTFKEDLLRHLLVVEENEITKKIFYDYTDDRSIFPSSHFINFIAEQDSFNYLRESLICYLLHPNDLYQIDKQIFFYFKEHEK